MYNSVNTNDGCGRSKVNTHLNCMTTTSTGQAENFPNNPPRSWPLRMLPLMQDQHLEVLLASQQVHDAIMMMAHVQTHIATLLDLTATVGFYR